MSGPAAAPVSNASSATQASAALQPLIAVCDSMQALTHLLAVIRPAQPWLSSSFLVDQIELFRFPAVNVIFRLGNQSDSDGPAQCSNLQSKHCLYSDQGPNVLFESTTTQSHSQCIWLQTQCRSKLCAAYELQA